jgi:hypothetical protein
MSSYKRKEVMDYLIRKPVTTQDIELARTRVQPLAARIEQPETDYQTEVQPDMVIPPQDVLPKNPEPVMPFAPGIPNPQDRILELADGGRIELAGGGDPEKIARIKELVESGKYNKTQIIDLLRKEGYGRTRTGKDSLVNKIANELEVDLPVGMTEKGFSAQEAKGKYLPFYNNEKLEVDLKKGKTLQDIGKDLYENNKKYYNKIGITENNIAILNNAISSKIRKSENLIKLNEKNINKNIKQQEQVLKDVDSFIKNNKQKYLNQYQNNKIGAPEQFKNELIDFIEKKHPDYVKITTTYNPKNPLPMGSKVLDLPNISEREITKAGDYGRDVFLKKKIRSSLNIPERPAKGEGISFDRLDRNYNFTTQELLKQAQQKGTIPKVYTGKSGVKIPIDSESAYYRYAKQLGVDPINKLFEGQVKFGVEHVGGIARAGKIGDYETLNKVLAFDSYTNKFIKGNSFDSRMTNLMEIAKQSEPTKAKEYIETINDLSTKAEKQYGIPLTKYKIVKDKIIAFHPDISLTDSTFKKAKLAINSFITNDGLNHPNFEKLDTDLQKTIVNYSKDKTKEADALLKGVLKQKGLSAELIPGMRSIIDSKIFNNLIEAGSPAVNSIVKNSSNISKATGLPFNVALGALLNSEQMEEKGLSLPKALTYGAIKGATEDVLNFGAQIIAAGPLMQKTLFENAIKYKEQPPEGIDSFDQVGGKQGLQSKFFNELFNIAPFQVTEMLSTKAAEKQTTKETIDNLVNLQTRKQMAKLYPSPDISETTVPGENNIMQQQEKQIKKDLYKNIFQDPKTKEEYEKEEIKPITPEKSFFFGPLVITPKEKIIEEPKDDLYIPLLAKEDPSIREGVLNLAFGGRVNFAGGGGANFLKMLRNISDSILEIKNSTHILGNTARFNGVTKAAEEALTPYVNIPNQNKHTTVLETIKKAKENLPKEYHSILEDMKLYADKHAYDKVDDMAIALDKVIDPNLKFESLPKDMFPMEDPLNSAFIIMDPQRNNMKGRFVHSVRIDPETGRGTRETFDTFDSKTRTFLKREDWKPMGVESIEKGKEGLN